MRKSFGWAVAVLLCAGLTVPAMAKDAKSKDDWHKRHEERREAREKRWHEHEAHERDRWREREREREERREARRHEEHRHHHHGWRSDSWADEHGKKTGWHGGTQPPGQAKK